MKIFYHCVYTYFFVSFIVSSYKWINWNECFSNDCQFIWLCVCCLCGFLLMTKFYNSRRALLIQIYVFCSFFYPRKDVKNFGNTESHLFCINCLLNNSLKLYFLFLCRLPPNCGFLFIACIFSKSFPFLIIQTKLTLKTIRLPNTDSIRFYFPFSGLLPGLKL